VNSVKQGAGWTLGCFIVVIAICFVLLVLGEFAARTP
jgi:hypothetical protein